MRVAAILLGVALTISSVASVAAETGAKRFTIAVVPDTQNYVDYHHQKAAGFPFDASELLLEQMRYIAANAKDAGGDIAFVTAVGDLWQHGSLRMDPAHEARGFKRVDNPYFGKWIEP